MRVKVADIQLGEVVEGVGFVTSLGAVGDGLRLVVFETDYDGTLSAMWPSDALVSVVRSRHRCGYSDENIIDAFNRLDWPAYDVALLLATLAEMVEEHGS